MSKLIVEMEMPQRCFDCPMYDWTSDRRSSLPSAVKPVCNAHHELKPIPNANERPSWCPILGVLSEDGFSGGVSNEITKAWERYLESERAAERIAVEEEFNRRRRELETIKAERKDDELSC